MVNFYKYLPLSKHDESWGLTVLNAGCTHIAPANNYPQKGHPAHHNFKWSNWRVLPEYQMIYITNGRGVFESESVAQTVVEAGTIIFLFPNERHRYKPGNETGWDEFWVGLKGNILDNLYQEGILRREAACLYIGFNDTVLSLFNAIIEQTRDERPGYQPLIAGMVLHLLGACHAIVKQATTESKDKEIIDKARLLFRANISNTYSAEMAANELNVGYSWFRKLFKNYTGLSPGQYFLQLRIEKAKEMLSTTDMPVKEISVHLNFESGFYFSKIFKEKTGQRPTDYRKSSSLAVPN